MLHAENTLQQQSAAPGLILLNSSFKPVSYNAESIRILTYPQDSKQSHSLTKHIEAKLLSVLPQLGFSRRTPVEVPFRSGRRQYVIRMFTITNFRNVPHFNSSAYPVCAVLLERQDHKCVDLCTIATRFHLTPREKVTLEFLLIGLTSKEIANRMDISPNTVKAFLRLVMSKMQVSTRSGIIGKIVTISH